MREVGEEGGKQQGRGSCGRAVEKAVPSAVSTHLVGACWVHACAQALIWAYECDGEHTQAGALPSR